MPIRVVPLVLLQTEVVVALQPLIVMLRLLKILLKTTIDSLTIKIHVTSMPIFPYCRHLVPNPTTRLTT
jgi:hypothetical protein